MKKIYKIFIVLAIFFLFGFFNFANAANCPGTCKGTCADDERTMAWFSGLRFDNCSVLQACCVKDAAGGNCPGTCRSGSCPDGEYAVGWTGYNDCSALLNKSCCMKAAPSTKPTTNTGVGATNPTTANPAAGASPSTSPTAGTAANTGGTGTSTKSVPNGGLVPCGLGGAADCTLCHLVLGFKNIYDYLLTLLLVATTLVVVVAGVMYMVSSGDKGMIDKAKSALTYALTAMILGLLAWLIINATLNALGFKNAGSWWNFTCDTTQTQGPTGGTGTGTLPGSTTPGQNTGTPNGNCGGIKTVGESSGKCDTASPELSSLLKCINDKLGPGSGVYISNRGLNRGTGCHGGGNCSGTANAADLFGGSPTASANAAKECGTADTILINGKAYYGPGNSNVGNQSDHFDHAHISVNNKNCRCDWAK